MMKVSKNTLKATIKRNGFVNITMYPCKANVNSSWFTGHPITVNSLEDLEKRVKEFTYYNCNNEVGKYPVYYI